MVYMNEIKLTPTQSWSATLIFVHSLWEFRKDQFSEEGVEGLAMFTGCLYSDPASCGDWQDTYKFTFGYVLTRNDLLFPEVVFTVLIELCAMFVYKWDYGNSELLAYLYKIRYTPEEYTIELEWWQSAIKQALNGKKIQNVIFNNERFIEGCSDA